MDWLLFCSDSHEAAWIPQPGVLGGAVLEDSSQLGLTPGGKTNYKGLRGWGVGSPLSCCAVGRDCCGWLLPSSMHKGESWAFEKGGEGKRYLNWYKSVIIGSLGLLTNAWLKNWVSSVFSYLCWSPAWIKPVLYYFAGYVYFFLLFLTVNLLRLGSCLVWLLGAQQRWC